MRGVIRFPSEAEFKAAIAAYRARETRGPVYCNALQHIADGWGNGAFALVTSLADDGPDARSRSETTIFRATICQTYLVEIIDPACLFCLKKLGLSATKCNHRLVRICSLTT
jgi:hypothetical protein